MRIVPLILGAVALSLFVAVAAEAALPPAAGGAITLPAPAPLLTLDPARADNAFEASLADATFDGLYRWREGRAEALLAAGPPELEGRRATIRLAADLRHHAGRLRASHVVRSLLRASTAPRAAWLFAAIAREEGRPAIRAVDAETIEIDLASDGVDLARLLAAPSLAIVVGGSVERRPLGTGPFGARLDGRGGLELTRFRYPRRGAARLDRIRVAAPSARDEALRAFELGRIDLSRFGESLYGRAPTRPVRERRASGGPSLLLVPNRARALGEGSRWAAVASAIERGRLSRFGLAEGVLGLEGARATRVVVPALTMLVDIDDAFEASLAEALAGMLDARGVRLRVEALPRGRHASALEAGRWDLRLVWVMGGLPGRGPRLAEALALTGQLDRARRVALALDDDTRIEREARALDAIELGVYRERVHHRADLLGLRHDESGRLALDALHLARPEPTP